jgi:hypothetical protein
MSRTFKTQCLQRNAEMANLFGPYCLRMAQCSVRGACAVVLTGIPGRTGGQWSVSVPIRVVADLQSSSWAEDRQMLTCRPIPT